MSRTSTWCVGKAHTVRGGEHSGLGSQVAWVQILTLLATHCVTMGESCDLSVPLFAVLAEEDEIARLEELQ